MNTLTSFKCITHSISVGYWFQGAIISIVNAMCHRFLLKPVAKDAEY